MSTAPPLDEHTSPLNAQQAQQVNALIQSLSPTQVNWLSGYLAGVTAHTAVGAVAQPQPAAGSETGRELTILIASQTGNAEGVAEQAAALAREKGFSVNMRDMGEYKPRNIKKEKHVLVVASTHGEGDPPDNAVEFYEYLHSDRAPKLDGLKFSVLALGDTSYEHYCQIGRDFDAVLEKLGGERVHERVDCDVDYEDDAEKWVNDAVGVFDELVEGEPSAPSATVTPLYGGPAAAPTSQYNKKNPYPAEILESIVLNGRGSSKAVRHMELLIEGSGLTFEPGDSIGVVAENDPAVADELIHTLDLDPDEEVTGAEGETKLRDALIKEYEITTLTRPVIEKYATIADSEELRSLLEEDQRKALMEYIEGRFAVDMVEQYPVEGISGRDFIHILRKLPTRLYSIASSHKANPEEVHITVGEVRYNSYGRDRVGVASGHLADRVEVGDTVPIYVDANKNFRLPADGDTPIIMVGPGTGIAPFRAFLEERQELGHEGKNWLFFGDRNFTTDFLYQIEWQRWIKDGVLTKMDVAFSRDQEEKIYVQHRMLENSKQIYEWLQEGAQLYVCGDADYMAHDVHDALHKIVENEGGLSEDGAADYVKQLQKEKRYQRDVY